MTAASTPVAAFAMRPDLPALLFSSDDLAALRSIVVLDATVTITDFATAPAGLLDSVEILVTGWGAPHIGPAELDRMPLLRAIVHAAGTVKGHIDDAAWDRGVLVTSAANANAYPVAEYTLAMILLAGKGVPDYIRGYATDPALYEREADPAIGNFRRTVGIIGASRVGRRVIELLEPFDIDVLLYDPQVRQGDPVLERARAVTLDDLFAGSSIVSVHAPLLPETVGMVGAAQLALLPDGATLINTARAPIVDQEALTAAVRDRGLRAVLDVTEPEPLPAEHPLRSLPGVVLTPHVAGALGTEVRRLGECARHEIERFVAGEPAEHPVTKEALIAVA
ncbi:MULTISPECIES: hydroxyacid dehydrogenase [unclassified Leifsonia]|uniref:hydroxyacid dehydrogenase n=1 Tax=unclassified Leifsonia TaxID=2663824 RepID=UPI0003768C3C|nr:MULTISPECIES: hydroxyacid dehydrogenase [unclassified Leifsonia]TDQ02674.1 phosphoglycerate dehydrogenase-like enzyme [Leifsonia sp. 115AMFTsu3.1]